MTTARHAKRPRTHTGARLRAGLITATLTLGLSAVPATLATAPASAKPKPGPVAKCSAGALKKDTAGNVTHVCNKDGKWVAVLNLIAPSSDAAGAAVSDGALATRAEKKGGSGAATGCALGDGTTAGLGEQYSVVTDYRDASGALVKRIISNFICGADGKWHAVARLRGAAIAVVAQTIQVTR